MTGEMLLLKKAVPWVCGHPTKPLEVAESWKEKAKEDKPSYLFPPMGSSPEFQKMDRFFAWISGVANTSPSPV